MEELIIQTLAGLVVALLSGITGYLIRKKFSTEGNILPVPRNYNEPRSYGHLNGNWHCYWISYDPADILRPAWIHGVEEIQIEKNNVKGISEHINHPVVTSFHYRIKGEIRAGRMILTETAIEDPTEFISAFYPNLLSSKLLAGFWTGQDNLLRPITGPIILARDELTHDKLEKVLKNSNLRIVPIGEYRLDSEPPNTHKSNFIE